MGAKKKLRVRLGAINLWHHGLGAMKGSRGGFRALQGAGLGNSASSLMELSSHP